MTALSLHTRLGRVLCRTIMEVLFLIIAISIVAAAGFLVAFLWAVRSGQYDDDQTPAMRMLFEDKTTQENKTKQ